MALSVSHLLDRARQAEPPEAVDFKALVRLALARGWVKRPPQGRQKSPKTTSKPTVALVNGQFEGQNQASLTIKLADSKNEAGMDGC
jgi:hypothetical protein